VKYLEAMAKSKRYTAKYRGYASLYDQVVATLPDRPTVLEVGIANGGSLETWRTLLGPEARIIGVDLNERCRTLEAEGFEVHILDTGTPDAWTVLRESVGRNVDLLVDDGGHTNRQQINALVHGVDLVRDGGWLVIEDLHASFMREFGNPSRHSTTRFLDELTADLHRRHPRAEAPLAHPNLAGAVESILHATSWVGLRIDRGPHGLDEITAGEDSTLMDYDHRWDSSFGHSLAGRLPAPLLRVVRNRWTRQLDKLSDRRLFRSDAADD
jgi:hypothetical protein